MQFVSTSPLKFLYAFKTFIRNTSDYRSSAFPAKSPFPTEMKKAGERTGHEVFLHCFNMTGSVRGRGSEAEGSQMMDRSCSILRNRKKNETKEILLGTSTNNMRKLFRKHVP